MTITFWFLIVVIVLVTAWGVWAEFSTPQPPRPFCPDCAADSTWDDDIGDGDHSIHHWSGCPRE